MWVQVEIRHVADCSALRSFGFITISLEEIVAFLVSEEIADVPDRTPEVVVGPCGCSPE